MDTKIKNKVAVVLVASKRLGKACAISLASQASTGNTIQVDGERYAGVL